MNLSPEWQIVIINAVACVTAYFVIYPSFRPITWTKVLLGDAVVTLAALAVAGLLFAGTGVTFTLIAIETHWVLFSLVVFFVIEAPLVLWFAQTQDIKDDRD